MENPRDTGKCRKVVGLGVEGGVVGGPGPGHCFQRSLGLHTFPS